ncbi:hypothetical protein PBY51_004157 [Eleginops maclovinus]|uniref:Uncharacterized protein n=1 Tax=Eleginops maclovinus TaxID=56733 RepID=A0AAN7Y2K8_ELEMC|nr:hypothetical protein PBY51_004157 [Eleginops maclovinus]
MTSLKCHAVHIAPGCLLQEASALTLLLRPCSEAIESHLSPPDPQLNGIGTTAAETYTSAQTQATARAAESLSSKIYEFPTASSQSCVTSLPREKSQKGPHGGPRGAC